MWQLLQPVISNTLDKIIDFIPNPNERKKLKMQAEHDLQQAIIQASRDQIEVNKVEAAHKSVFVAGWRPFIGWTCGAGLFWAFVLQPMLSWTFTGFLPAYPVPPQIRTDELYQLVLAMLGMGGLRTYEKTKGVSREN